MAEPMKRAGGLVVVALIVLGICYNFILPFTPIWLDVVAWTAIGLAFLVAAVVNRKSRGERKEQDGAT